MKRIILGIAATIILAGASPAAETREIRLDTHQFQFSPEVVIDPKDETVRLAQSALITDEIGATDHYQVETLSDKVWAQKIFILHNKEGMRDPELFIFGRPKQILVNNKPLKHLEPLSSTGWTRAKLPREVLELPKALFVAPGWENKAIHTIVMRGGGQLLFEPSRHVSGRNPRTSNRSADGGQTWSKLLGSRGAESGEYLARLRVRSYAPDGSLWGWAMSPVLDLWAGRPSTLATPGATITFKGLAKLNEGQPKDTVIRPFLRTGPTPSFDPRTWTAWEWIHNDHKPDDLTSQHRWAQLKFELDSGRANETPRLPAQFKFSFDFQSAPVTNKESMEVTRHAAESRIVQTSVPFTYQAPSPRLKLLRERYKLDEVIAPGKTEMEQLMLLRHWVRNQWHTAWQGGPASWMPPWDAHIILDCKDQPNCLTMCTHYAAVFTQCCLALGWTARHCILDHHCVSEVFVNQHNKWVMMDAGNSKERADVGLHFERAGVPLSALELHLAYHQKKTDGITVHFTPKALAEKIASLCRPEPAQPARPARKAKKPMATGPRPDAIPLAELEQYPVCQINNYRRYAFPARNNYLDSLLPGELYQGWSSYFYDGYWWVGDSPDDPKLSPEYSKHLDPARPQDIDWPLNWTRIHLARTAKAGELQVDLETLTPNFARFETQVDGKWKPTPARFTWTVQKGENALRVRSVNQFERPGIEASVQVKRGE